MFTLSSVAMMTPSLQKQNAHATGKNRWRPGGGIIRYGAPPGTVTSDLRPTLSARGPPLPPPSLSLDPSRRKRHFFSPPPSPTDEIAPKGLRPSNPLGDFPSPPPSPAPKGRPRLSQGASPPNVSLLTHTGGEARGERDVRETRAKFEGEGEGGGEGER